MKIEYYILIVALLLSNCYTKDDYIRDVYVDINIDLSLPEYSDLNTIGNSVMTDIGGNAGLIIYHFAIDGYKVYDRNCSYEPSQACAYIDSVNSTVAYCGCCSSAFLIDQDGVAANPPALMPLKMYNWSLNTSNNILKIFNY